MCMCYQSSNGSLFSSLAISDKRRNAFFILSTLFDGIFKTKLRGHLNFLFFIFFSNITINDR